MPHWPKNKAYFWEEAPFFRLLLPLIGGIWLYDVQLLGGVSVPKVLGVFFLVAVLLVVTGLLRIQTRLTSVLHPLAVIVFFGCAGWLLYAASDATRKPDYFGNQLANAKAQLAVVRSERTTSATQRYELEIIGNYYPELKRASGRALLYVYRKQGDTAFTVGDTLIVPSHWVAITNGGNPFAFSNKEYQRRNNINWQQFVQTKALVRVGKMGEQQRGFIARIHQFSEEQLRRYIQSSAAFGLLKAMLLGDEADFDLGLRQAYAQTGIIHIVSISGSHVAMMFVLVSGLLFWLKGRQANWIKYLLGLAVVWLYVLVAGAPPSAVRSALMFSFVAFGVISGREGQALNTLFAAAFVLLIGQPQWLFAIGFQLSFLAVLSIMLFYKPLLRLWPQGHLVSRWLWQGICVSFAAEILIAPLVIYYFHSFPLLFLVANLVATLVLGVFALFRGVAILILCWIPFIAQLLGEIIGALVAGFNQLIVLLQGWSPGAFNHLQLTFFEMLLLYALLIATALWLIHRRPKALIFGMFTMVLLLSSITINKVIAWRQPRLIAYNMGKQPYVELQYGGYFQSLTNDPGDNYVIHAAHTGFYSWKRARQLSDFAPYFEFAGKRILILKDSSKYQFSGSLSTDIVLFARTSTKLDKLALLQSLRPKTLVLTQRLSAYQLNSWRQACSQISTQLHYVATDGAYILQ
ncbi:MAG: ComEC/Rec2 family competence protein [Bacteroidetes bacterium]|nr:ComEC/Rec2 family competence protein [Bacteroidota bacterium]